MGTGTMSTTPATGTMNNGTGTMNNGTGTMNSGTMGTGTTGSGTMTPGTMSDQGSMRSNRRMNKGSKMKSKSTDGTMNKTTM